MAQTNKKKVANMKTDDSATQGITPLLSTYDWNAEWMELQKFRHKPEGPAYWNNRAHTFPRDKELSPYAKRFLEFAAIKEGETILDMGCGTGALALPLARAGHEVLACDFSEAMLGRMGELISELGIQNITQKQLSWTDNWHEHGLKPNMVDVALASRSIATPNLRDSLLKLSDVAKRKVCITVNTGSSPRIDNAIFSELGLNDKVCRSYMYVLNILANEGFFPTVSYIPSTRYDSYANKEEAFENLKQMIDHPVGIAVSPAEKQAAYEKLDAWLDENLIENSRAGMPDSHGEPERAFRLKKRRVITWAFISWEV